MWHLTVLAFYGIAIMAFCGICGLTVYLYERWLNRDALKLDSGLVFMRDFSNNKY